MTERVFIVDTNVFISGLLGSVFNSPTVKILDAMLNSAIIYVLSPALLQEYQEVLLRPKLVKLHKLTENEIEQLLSELVANGIWRETAKLHHAPDKGDDHLWNLLLQTDNTILITGDQLLIEKPPSGKSVISPASYLDLYHR